MADATTPSTVTKILTGLDIAAGALVASGQLPGWASQALGAVCLVLTYLGYGNTKQQLATLGKAAVVALTWLLPVIAVAGMSCATIKPALVTAGGAFVACGEADASSLFAQVGQIIATNAANLEASLTALAATVGRDAVKCAIAALDALTKPSTSVTAEVARASGLTRANAWAANK